MKSNGRRYRRHRNPENAENKETPFFTPRQKAVQKKEDAFFQPKLAVGQPGDSYEQEADAVASKVVNKQPVAGNAVQRKEISAVQKMPEEEVQKKDAPEKKEEEKKVQKKDTPEKKEEEKKVQKKDAPEKKEEEKKVQKKDAPEKKEEEKKVQKKSDKKEEEKPIQKKEEPEKKPAADEVLKEEKEKPGVMAKAKPGGLQQDTDGLSQQLKEQRNRGASLSPEVRNEMSSAIGADFDGVRIHTDAKATELSNELGAQAFTHGNDVYFNSGKYDTESSTGKQLLAHELTHVVQQGAAPALSGSKKATSVPGVQREMSTPLPAGVKPDKKSKVASFIAGDFKVEVKPDRKARKGEEVDAEGATTKGQIAYGLHPKWTKDGKVEGVTITKKLIIETVYAAKASAASTSEYGRGSLKKDIKEGHGTLGFHEGSHGTDFINYVTTHPFPEIVIESPISEDEYKALVAEWKTKYDAYLADMQQTSIEKTDNVKDPVEE